MNRDWNAFRFSIGNGFGCGGRPLWKTFTDSDPENGLFEKKNRT